MQTKHHAKMAWVLYMLCMWTGSCAHETWEGGIHARMRYSEQAGLRVAEVPARSPALEAGLQVGDRIVTIDEQAVKNMTMQSVVQKLRGAVGSTVALGIVRGEQKLTLHVERAPYK